MTKKTTRFLWHSPTIQNRGLHHAAMMVFHNEKNVKLGIRLMRADENYELKTLQNFSIDNGLKLEVLEPVLPGAAITVSMSGNPNHFETWVDSLKQLLATLVGESAEEFLLTKIKIRKGMAIVLHKYVVDEEEVPATYVQPGGMFQYMDGYIQQYHEVRLPSGRNVQVSATDFSIATKVNA